MDRGVVRIEEAAAEVARHVEDGGEVGIDDAAVANHSDAVPAMRRDDLFDRADRPAVEFLLGLVTVPDAVQHLLPAWVVVGFQLFDGDVFGAETIELGDSVAQFDVESALRCHRLRGLTRALHCARIDRIEMLR